METYARLPNLIWKQSEFLEVGRPTTYPKASPLSDLWELTPTQVDGEFAVDDPDGVAP